MTNLPTPWEANITVYGTRISLGTYTTYEEAKTVTELAEWLYKPAYEGGV